MFWWFPHRNPQILKTVSSPIEIRDNGIIGLWCRDPGTNDAKLPSCRLVLDQGGTPGSGNMLSSRVFSPIISFIQNINVNVFITTTFYYEPYANKLDQPSTAPYLYSTAHIQHIHIPCWFSIKLRKSTSNVQYHDSWFLYVQWK